MGEERKELKSEEPFRGFRRVPLTVRSASLVTSTVVLEVPAFVRPVQATLNHQKWQNTTDLVPDCETTPLSPQKLLVINGKV